MKYIAHRGKVTKGVLENSKESFYNAFNDSKYIGIEADIRVTKDNVFILYHDVLYEGNLIKNMNYNELENVDKLTDLLKIKTNKIMLLEIKDFDMNLKRFIKVLNKYKRNIYIMSFSDKVINKLYNMKPTYKVGVLNYVLNTPDIYKYDFVCIINGLLSNYVIDAYKKQNTEVIGYGVFKNNMKYDIPYIVDDDILL